MTQLAAIDRFLAGKRFALVGVSAQPNDFSRAVLRELTQHGYEVVPINPHIETVDGLRGYARVLDVPGPLDGVILMTSPRVTSEVVRDCATAKVPRVWMHRGVGAGAVSDEAIRFCEAHEIEVIAGECPLMFLSQTGPHAVHAAVRKAFGSYPHAPAESSHVPLSPILAQAVAAWTVSAAALLLLRLTGVPETLALWLHAMIAPLAFAASSAAYFHRPDTSSPMRVALLNVAVVALLDLGVIAGLLMRSWALHTSVAGAWLPLILIFAVTVVVGTRRVPRYHSV